MGFVRIDQKDLPKLEIGRSSIDRVMRLLQVLAKTAEERGQQFVQAEEGLQGLVGCDVTPIFRSCLEMD